MASPVFNAMGNGGMPQNGMMNMLQQFKQFKNSFKGNPKDEVMRMLQSGQISQGQLNQLQQAAQQFQSIMGQ